MVGNGGKRKEAPFHTVPQRWHLRGVSCYVSGASYRKVKQEQNRKNKACTDPKSPEQPEIPIQKARPEGNLRDGLRYSLGIEMVKIPLIFVFRPKLIIHAADLTSPDQVLADPDDGKDSQKNAKIGEKAQKAVLHPV